MQRVQAQHRIAEQGMHAEVFERQAALPDHALPRKFQVHVHGVPPVGGKRGIGQHLAAAAGLGRSCGGRAKHRAQVCQAQLPGCDAARELAARRTRNKAQVAMQIALAHGAGEVAVVPHRPARLQAALQLTLGLKSGRIGQHQAGQRIQVGHAGALEHHLQIHARQRARVGQNALYRGFHTAGLGGELQGVVHLLVAQREHGACLALALDAGLAQRAFQVKAHAIDRGRGWAGS